MKFTKPTNRILLVVFLCVCAVYCLTPVHNGNFFWHIRNGEDILDTGEIRTSDPFTWSVRGEEWLQQEWVAEVLFAVSWRAPGEAGPVILKMFIILFSILLISATARLKGAGIRSIVIVAVLWFVLSHGRWIVRPHIFTIFFFSLYLYLIERGTGGFWKSILIFIPLQIIWTNTHAGFITGYFLLSIPMTEEFIRRKWKKCGKKAGVLLVAILSAGIHPNGYGSIAYLTDFYKQPLFRESIREWWSPFHSHYQPGHTLSTTAILLVILLVGTWAIIIWKRKQSSPVKIGAFLILSLAAIMTSRNIDLLALAAVAWIPPLLKNVRLPVAIPASMLAVTIAIPVLIGIPREIGPPRDVGAGIDWSIYPVELVAYLRENPELLHARVLNTNEVSGYLQYEFGDELPLYMDGRCLLFPEDLYREYLFLTTMPDTNITYQQLAILEEKEIELVLMNYPQHKGSVLYSLAASPDWLPLYWDNLTVVYAKRSFLLDNELLNLALRYFDPLIETEILETPLYEIPMNVLVEATSISLSTDNNLNALIVCTTLISRNSSATEVIDSLLILTDNTIPEELLSALNGNTDNIDDPRLLTLSIWNHASAGNWELAINTAQRTGDLHLYNSVLLLSGIVDTEILPPPMIPQRAFEDYMNDTAGIGNSSIITASALFTCGMADSALSVVRSVFANADSLAPWGYSTSGVLMQLAGMDSLAQVYCDSAISYRRNPYTLGARANIAEYSGNVSTAVDYYAQVLTFSPNFLEARAHLANCLWNSGDMINALVQYQYLENHDYLSPIAKMRLRWGMQVLEGQLFDDCTEEP